MDLATIRYRLRNDFQLAVLSLLGAVAVLGVFPFALLRAYLHEWLAFFTDLFVIAGILASVFYAWHSGDTQRPSTLLCYFIGLMSVIACHVLGIHGTYWVYPALIANFFLTHRRHAFFIAILVLLALFLSEGLHREPRELASYSATLIVSVMLAYAFAYRTAMQREELARLASIDALTGVYNRRELMQELKRVERLRARENKRFGLLLLDLDHFKRINDTHGHAQGDEVLIRFARLLEGVLRPLDRLFRFGGEEFVILTDADDAGALQAMAEKLRCLTERQLDDGHGHGVTTSIGGALLRAGETSEQWLARADAALYAAKHAGRNRVVIDDEAT